MAFTRNPYLITKAMRNFLWASILTMALAQVNTTVDGIIVSHLVAPDALSAVNLYMPISLLITSFSTLFGISATIVAARALGERDKLSLIVIDQAQHITGNVFLPWNTTRDIVKDDSVGVLAAYVHQMGGNRCIIYGSEDGVRMTDSRTMTKLSSQLKTFGVRLDDVMSVSRSAFQEGIYYEI